MAGSKLRLISLDECMVFRRLFFFASGISSELKIFSDEKPAEKFESRKISDEKPAEVFESWHISDEKPAENF